MLTEGSTLILRFGSTVCVFMPVVRGRPPRAPRPPPCIDQLPGRRRKSRPAPSPDRNSSGVGGGTAQQGMLERPPPPPHPFPPPPPPPPPPPQTSPCCEGRPPIESGGCFRPPASMHHGHSSARQARPRLARLVDIVKQGDAGGLICSFSSARNARRRSRRPPDEPFCRDCASTIHIGTARDAETQL